MEWDNKIRAFLYAGLVAVLLCLIGLVFVVFRHMEQVKEANAIDHLRREKAVLIEKIRDGVYSRSYIIPYTAVLDDYFDRYEQKDVFAESAAIVSDSIAQLDKFDLNEEERWFFSNVRRLIMEMRPVVEGAMDLAVEDPQSELLKPLLIEARWRQRDLQVILTEFAGHSNTLANREFTLEERRLDEAQKRIILLAIGLSFSALGITVFLLWHGAQSRRLLQEAVEERTRELRFEKEKAQLASRAKTEFLSSTSHELRTPLNAIIGFAHTLRTGVFGQMASPKHDEYLEDIQTSGEHLLSLINDILDVSAIEEGQLKLDEDALDLHAIADSCLQLVSGRAQKGHVRVVNTISKAMPKLWADERRLKQIVLNLLSNAVKFTPELGKVKITATQTEDGALALTVSDTGIGMTEEDLLKAMTPFGQVDGGLDRKNEGTGLGLPLTQGLVELHGGRLAFDSAPGEGTAISAVFPKERVIDR